MKKEITIPPQYAQIIKAEAERRNISIEDIIGIADREQLPEWARKQLERFESVEPRSLLNDEVDFGELSETIGPTMI